MMLKIIKHSQQKVTSLRNIRGMVLVLLKILKIVVICFVVMVVPTVTYAANWVLVSSLQGSSWYIDGSDIRQYDGKIGTIQFWSKVVIDDPFKHNNIKTMIAHTEVKLEQEYKKQQRQLQMIYYDDKDKIVWDSNGPMGWQEVPSSSGLNQPIIKALSYLPQTARKSNWLVISDLHNGSGFLVDTVNIQKEIGKLHVWTSLINNKPSDGVGRTCYYNEVDLTSNPRKFRVVDMYLYDSDCKLLTSSTNEPEKPDSWKEILPGSNMAAVVDISLVIKN